MLKAFPSGVKWVFLDLDNTLWDFDANATEALKELFRRHNLHLHTDYHVDQFVALYQDVNAAYWKRYERGEVSKEVLRSARFTDTFDAMGIPTILQPADVWQEYLDICPLMTLMMPNALKSLEVLSQRFNVALLTNGFEATQQTKIRCSGIEPYVKFMVTSESLGVAKPSLLFLKKHWRRQIVGQTRPCIWEILGIRMSWVVWVLGFSPTGIAVARKTAQRKINSMVEPWMI